MVDLQSTETALCNALNLPSQDSSSTLGVLELGTGCGIVGMTLASVLSNCEVCLSDLPEARDIVEKNITNCARQLRSGSKLSFLELDWDDELPDWFQREEVKFDLVLAADCTYNSDSRYDSCPTNLEVWSQLTFPSPALVSTLSRLADLNKQVVVGIAMKMRHDSERVFFDLMAEAGFKETALLGYPLPGDIKMGEDTVYLHVYKHAS